MSKFHLPAAKLGETQKRRGMFRLDVGEDEAETGVVMGHGRRCRIAFTVTRTEAERSGRPTGVHRNLQANGIERMNANEGRYSRTTHRSRKVP